MFQNRPRVAIYIRVSSEMQLDNYSLDAQENACQSFVELRDWQAVKVFREEGASAKSLERPVFQEMLQSAERGAFEIVLVHKLDRFSRKLKDMLTIIDYFDDIGVALVSATEQFDLSTPQGKMMINVMGSVNQWYVDNLAQEIKKGKRQRAKSGDWNGTLSYGYTTPKRLKDELTKLSNELKAGNITRERFREKVGLIEDTLDKHPYAHDTSAIPCPFQSLGVVMAYEQYATGQYSFAMIADILNESGYRCESRDGTGLFKKDMIGELLRNRFYLGETSYGAKVRGKKRQWIDGNHDAIISQGLFDKCQSVRKTFSTKHKAHNRARPYPLTPMLFELSNGAKYRGRFRAKEREYVRERFGDTPGTHIKAEGLEMEVVKTLGGIVIPDEWYKTIVRNIGAITPQKPNFKSLEERLERLKKLFLLGDISEENYLAEREEIKQLLAPKKPEIVTIEGMIEVAEIMKNLNLIWENATLEERDKLAKMLFHKVYISEKSVVAIEPTAMLWQLIQSLPLTALRRGQVTNLHRGRILPFNSGIEIARLRHPKLS